MSVLVFGTALAAIVLFIVSRHILIGRSVPTTGLGARLLDFFSDHPSQKPSLPSTQQAVPGLWQTATVNSLSAAADLLDCAEASGYSELELVVLGNSTFLVRWR